jgi:hypothetical protein
MDRAFLVQSELPEAEYYFDVGSGTHAEQTGENSHWHRESPRCSEA